MKKLIISTILTAFIAVAGFAQEKAEPADTSTLVKIGEIAPDFTVTMFDGSKITLSDLKGKVVLLNFWATWCPPCRAELKNIQTSVIDRFKDNDNFVFIPISRGEKLETVEAFRENNGYSFPMGLDSDESIFHKYATRFIPRNFVIDKEGKIAKIEVGYSATLFNKMVDEIAEMVK